MDDAPATPTPAPPLETPTAAHLEGPAPAPLEAAAGPPPARPAAPPPADAPIGLDPGRRVALAIGAVIVAGYAVTRATDLGDAGYPLSAGVLVGLTGVLVAGLAALALAPAAVGRRLAATSRLRLGTRGHLVTLLALAASVFLVFGLGSALAFTLALEDAASGAAPESVPLGEADVVFGLVLNLLVLLLPVGLWLVFVTRLRGRDVLRAVGLGPRDASSVVVDVGVGLGTAIGAILLLVAVALAAGALGLPTPDNERALDIGQALSIPGAILVAVLASVSEEVFFRGFLQPRIGIVTQAILFAVAHISYFHVLQVVATLVLGFAFGIAYRMTGSLGAPLVAHFAFNGIMLVAASQIP